MHTGVVPLTDKHFNGVSDNLCFSPLMSYNDFSVRLSESRAIFSNSSIRAIAVERAAKFSGTTVSFTATKGVQHNFTHKKGAHVCVFRERVVCARMKMCVWRGVMNYAHYALRVCVCVCVPRTCCVYVCVMYIFR